MEWDEILKNQITSTKQGVLTSDAPLPKKEKKRDCNKILREMTEELNNYFELEVEQIIEKQLTNLATIINTNKKGGGTNLFRTSEQDIGINKGTVKSAVLNYKDKIYGNTSIRCAFGAMFVPFGDEKIACEVLDDMQKLRYGQENPRGVNKLSPDLNYVDLNLDGSIMDFDINYFAGSANHEGMVTIVGVLNIGRGDSAHARIREIFRDDYERIVRKVLAILKGK